MSGDSGPGAAEKKYELLTNQQVVAGGMTLYRIRALKEFGNVKEGDLGGFIASERNLSHDGECWVGDEARVHGDAEISGDARVYGRAEVFGRARVEDRSHVLGNARVFGNAWVFKKGTVFDNAVVRGSAQVRDEALVYGRAELTDRARVLGSGQVSGNTRLGGGAVVGGDDPVKNAPSEKPPRGRGGRSRKPRAPRP